MADEIIRLAVVSQTRLYREGLARALGEQDRFDVCGTAADLGSAVRLVHALGTPPDVVLLDHSIAEGASAIAELCQASMGLRVLAVAVREEEGDVLPWAEAGAAGFLPHDASFDELVHGISAVAEGCAFCSPRVAAMLLSRLASLAVQRRPAPALSELTQRERDVALLLQEGLSNKEIAARLRIQVATVKNHVHSILEKLEVRRRGEAASRVRVDSGA